MGQQFQQTLQSSIQVKGVGIHSGEQVFVTFKPAPENTGVVFRRIDLPTAVEIPAHVDNVVDTRLCTVLGDGEVRIATVEHVLSAFLGLGVDNAIIEVSAAELPIMDGSSEPFTFVIQAAGIARQSALRKFILIKEEIQVTDGDKSAALSPHSGCQFSFSIDYSHPVVGQFPQSATIDLAKSSYVNEISRARTFGFMRDYEKLKAMNLARGGSLDNAIVIDDDRILNEDGLRYPDELVKHKILDAMGDLYLLGHPIIGAFSGKKSGHALNHLLARTLMENPSTWELVTQ